MKNPLIIGGISFNRHLTFLIIYITQLPFIEFYYNLIPSHFPLERFLLYFALSALIIRFGWGERLQDYGFKLGKWREGVAWVAVVSIITMLVLLFLARQPTMLAYYRAISADSAQRILIANALDLFGWEFMWRGFLLFALVRHQHSDVGGAILWQAVPFAFMHLGKPAVETLTTIFGGIGFGFIAWRTQSMLYPWLIHWFIASFTMFIAIGLF